MLDRAVDSSFDELTTEEAIALRDNNWPLYIQCLWTAVIRPSTAIPSLRNAQKVGLPFATYISLNRYNSGAWHVDRARAGVPDDLWNNQLFTAIDVELDGIRVEDILQAIKRARELLPHSWQKVLLYTNYQSWTEFIIPRNSTAVADLGILLWNAYWDDRPNINYPTLRFGGWRDDQVAIEQWSGGTYIHGQFVDRNTIVRELLFPPEGGDVDELARNQIQRLSAMQRTAGLFLEVEAKLALNINIPSRIRDQVRWMLGGITPRKTSSRELLRVLFNYAAGRALSGEPLDPDTIQRLRYAVR